MRAAVFKGTAAGLVIEQQPDPVAQPGEVVIRVKRTGICGSELHFTADPLRPVPPNHILGHEICGEVVALGAGVDRLRCGDRIVPMPFVGCSRCAACLAGQPHRCPQGRMDVVHGYCEYTRAGAHDCIVLPAGLDDEDGALIEPLAVGLQGVRKAGLAPGARVLVTGAGPIGLAAAFFARRLGAGKVVVMAASSRRRDIALSMGATHFIALDGCEDAKDALMQVLGAQPDAVIEAVGLRGAIADAIDWVKPCGTVVSLGLCPEADSFRPEIATMKEVRLLFSLCYDRDDFRHTADVMAAGDTRPRAMITDRVTLDTLPAKFASLRGPSRDCKVMIDPWGLPQH
jgi:threonine dehydrogenase-like Zn-dependent dehydrogenase